MFRNNLKIAVRNLLKNRTYGFLNIMGLALSMTCGILIFTLVKYHLGFDNFHKNPNRIYRIVTEQHRDNVSYVASVPPAFGKAFRTDYNYDEQVARIVTFNNGLISVQAGNEVKKFKEKEGVAFVEEGFFDIFNFPLLHGNIKSVLSEPNTAIITQQVAEKYFGKEDAVNKIIKFDNKINCRITGVLKDLPANTDEKAQVFVSWSTLKTYNDWFASDDAWGGISSALQCFVRLRPGVSAAQIEKVLPAYVTKYRANNKNVHHYKLQPLSQVHFDARYGGVMEKRNLWILSFIGLFLIVTACVNFVNLATAQTLRRSKEVGIRKVLGSFRWQLFWQFVAETALITLTATCIAIALSYSLFPYVNDLFKTQMPVNVLSDSKFLFFILLLMLVVTFLAGAYPGLILSGFKAVTALKGKLSLQNVGGINTRRALIVIQFTISLVLIMGMIVITRQMQYAKQSDLGFDKDAVVMLPVGVDSAGPVMNTLKNQLANIAGVKKVSLCYAAPSSDDFWNNNIRFDTRTEDEVFKVNIKAADDQYVPTFGLQLVAGRNMFSSDSVREILINEIVVKKLNLKSPAEAIGKKIFFNNGGSSATVVGVLKDFHDKSFHEDIDAVCITTLADLYQQYAVKINLANITSILPALEKTWSNIHPDRIYEYEFLDDRIAAFYETENTMLKLIRAFSLIAIFIGCLGLYGLITFMVAQKTKEIGIRKVLGSSIADILWIFGREFVRLLIFACVIASPVAWWLMNNWLQDFKYHIEISAWVFILAIIITITIAMATIGYQSIRAALMNPVKSLRSE